MRAGFSTSWLHTKHSFRTAEIEWRAEPAIPGKASVCLISSPILRDEAIWLTPASPTTTRTRGVQPMTALLEQALAEVHKLPPDQQDAIAALILEELADEEKWDRAFAQSPDALARLADKVRAEKRAGQVKPMGF